MKRLGYTSYVAQGGDWGAVITEVMGAQAPKGLLGIHINMPGVIPPGSCRPSTTTSPTRSSWERGRRR